MGGDSTSQKLKRLFGIGSHPKPGRNVRYKRGLGSMSERDPDDPSILHAPSIDFTKILFQFGLKGGGKLTEAEQLDLVLGHIVFCDVFPVQCVTPFWPALNWRATKNRRSGRSCACTLHCNTQE